MEKTRFVINFRGDSTVTLGHEVDRKLSKAVSLVSIAIQDGLGVASEGALADGAGHGERLVMLK